MAVRSCWICGQPSATGEHRIKKSDLVQRFGKGPYTADDTLVHVKDGNIRDLQGPNSNLVKYTKNLCAQCNNTATQPFDNAYDTFIKSVMNSEGDILRHRVIDFEDVFGSGWTESQRDLFKYFAKCFGCRIDEAGQVVPQDVIGLLGQTEFTTAMTVTLQINEDQLILPDQDQSIGTQPLVADFDKKSREPFAFACGHNYRWLTINYFYNWYSQDPVGSPWVANAKYVYLGWYAPLNDVDRTNLKAKVSEK
jgi:hypothetical protein